MKYLTIDSGTVTTHETDKITLETMQKAVGGYIERAYDFLSPARPHHTIDVWVNEEGLLIGLPYNLSLATDYSLMPLHGPVLVTAGDEEGETLGLEPDEIAAVQLAGDVLVIQGRNVRSAL